MIEKFCENLDGQGSCDLCDILYGLQKESSSGLYYIKNQNGVYLRLVYGSSMFEKDFLFPKVVLCYRHALECDDIWKLHPSYKQIFPEVKFEAIGHEDLPF